MNLPEAFRNARRPRRQWRQGGLKGAVRLKSLERVAAVCSDFAEGTAVIAARPTVAPASSTNPPRRSAMSPSKRSLRANRKRTVRSWFA
jgi:hypothetical protein